MRDLVYISYRHKDRAWHRKLRQVLDADPDLRDRIWDDTKIPGGTDFTEEIKGHVARARVMIMLASEDYFGPESGALKFEAEPGLEAYANGQLEVLWVPVRLFHYPTSPVGKIMAATGAGAVPLEGLSPADQKRNLLKVHQEVRRCLDLPQLKESPPGKQRRRKKSDSARERRPAIINQKIERTGVMEPPIDFVIITPLEDEREAMLAHLGNPKRLPPTNENIRVYYPAVVPVTFTDGFTGEYKVVVTDLLQMGRVDAANAAGDAVRRWHPRYVLLVGIAGGLASAGVNVGDVLIAEQVADYELQKLRPRKKEIRWSVHRASPALLAASKQMRPDDWRPLVRERRPGPGQPQRHSGAICTGDKVIANDAINDYADVWAKLIGVEMEAGGVASAALQAPTSPGFFMVRGVSDLADPNKDKPLTESWRAYACDVAAAYMEAFLKSGPVVPLSQSQPPGALTESQPQDNRRKQSAAPAAAPGRKAIDVWREKLSALQVAEATSANPAQKFELAQQIAEAKEKIAELGG